MDALLAIKDLMARYKCSRPTAYKIMHMVPHIKPSKTLLVNEKDLERWEHCNKRYPSIDRAERANVPHLIPRTLYERG